MEIYLKVIAGVLIAAVLCVALSKQGTDISLLLTLFVCCGIMLSALTYLQPILDFAKRIAELGKLNWELLGILLKIVGIGLVSQVAGLICADAGNQSLGKALQILTTAVILCISVPLMEEMLSLIEALLGEV